jgi:prepilin-type N-terminal cleavage/methylation domain-containing protein
MRRASGFSLVECVVATVLVALGLLALSGATRAMLGLAILGHRTAGSAEVAAARLAQLRSAACAAAGPGEATSGGYAERWSVTGAGPTRSVTVDVSFAASGTQRTVRFEAVIACPN